MNRLIAKTRKSEQFSLAVTLIVVFLLLWLLNGPKFISVRNLRNMSYQLPIIGLLAIGMMISELSGGINLSIIANANLNGVIIYLVLNGITGGAMGSANIVQIIIAILVGFGTSTLIGLFNGLLIAKLNIPAILTTLGSMTLLQGINLVLTKGYTISGFPNALIFIGNGSVGGLPVPIIVFLIVVIIAHFVLNKSAFGLRLYMTGANRIACNYSNVNTTKVIVWEYILSAWFASVTSLIMIGQLNSVKANYAESYLLVAVLASFLGGVDPNGGSGRLSGMVLAAIILQLISSGLNLLRLDPFMITAMWGAIIIFLLFGRDVFKKLDGLFAKRSKGKEG
ncbi:MAG: ABC transporter permease [Sphaerochaetaceae bacterium]|jgi:simple sugar transport system permease protein